MAKLPTYQIVALVTNAAGQPTSTPVITPDSAIELDVSKDTTINSHPIELGQFEGYNRVQQPARVRLLLACQGINMTYDAFINKLQSLCEGTQLVTTSLPNDSYNNMALKGFNYSRKSEHGAVTIFADTFWVEERSTNVIVTAPATTAPPGAAPVDLGSVSPATPSVMQQAAISNPPVLPGFYPEQNAFYPQQVAAGITAMSDGGPPPSGYAF